VTDEPATGHLSIGIDPGVNPAIALILTEGPVFRGVNVCDVKIGADPISQLTAVEMIERLQATYAQMMIETLTEYGSAASERGLTVSLSIENVAMQHRTGQNPAAALKLTYMYALLAAAAAGMWADDAISEVHFPRPQQWQAFYALGLAEQPGKKAHVAMAKRVMQELCHRSEGNLTDQLGEDADEHDWPALDDHNLADALLIAARQTFTRDDGWTFFSPLAQGAN
jgi:hypothetical protein